jgi:putative phosphoserine phosphatase/1-acylglycerol-3-phosphate O-acyltransferase
MVSAGGSSIGAFIDFDGTLAAGFTGALLPWDRLRRGEMGVTEFLRLMWVAANYPLGRIGFEEFIRCGSMSLRGKRFEDLADIGERLYATNIKARIYPEMRRLVADHIDRGHTVVLTSAAFHLQIQPVARDLGITEMLCNWCELDADDILTGEVRKPILRGKSKADAVIDFAAANDIDLAESYFYADGDEDIALMRVVGKPRPTNPAGKLAELAAENGWPVQRFSSRSGNVPVALARTTLARVAALPLAAAAAGIAVLSFDGRRGAEFFAANWPQKLLDTAGVQLNISGAHHVDPGRRTVYLFNHRNAADAILVRAALARRRGPDSMVLALDATDDQPFRQARAAGVPVVPVVVRNAEAVADPDSAVLHPGTVDIAVLEPIPVRAWASDEFDERVAEVRRSFDDTLDNWPDI